MADDQVLLRTGKVGCGKTVPADQSLEHREDAFLPQRGRAPFNCRRKLKRRRRFKLSRAAATRASRCSRVSSKSSSILIARSDGCALVASIFVHVPAWAGRGVHLQEKIEKKKANAGGGGDSGPTTSAARTVSATADDVAVTTQKSNEYPALCRSEDEPQKNRTCRRKRRLQRRFKPSRAAVKHGGPPRGVISTSSSTRAERSIKHTLACAVLSMPSLKIEEHQQHTCTSHCTCAARRAFFSLGSIRTAACRRRSTRQKRPRPRRPGRPRPGQPERKRTNTRASATPTVQTHACEAQRHVPQPTV